MLRTRISIFQHSGINIFVLGTHPTELRVYSYICALGSLLAGLQIYGVSGTEPIGCVPGKCYTRYTISPVPFKNKLCIFNNYKYCMVWLFSKYSFLIFYNCIYMCLGIADGIKTSPNPPIVRTLIKKTENEVYFKQLHIQDLNF